MKVLLISDSHLYNEILDHVLQNNQADLIIHCGDSVFQQNEPLLEKMHVVRGNHDQDFLPIDEIIEIENHQCLITHGHCYNIYAGYETLYQHMIETNCDICFHGHTHVPYIKEYRHKFFINPGSIMFNRGQTNCGSYAIVNIDPETVDVHFYNSQTLEEIHQSLIKQNIAILNEFKELVTKFNQNRK